QHPFKINAKFLIDRNKEFIKEGEAYRYVGKCTSLGDHLKYKYLIDVDGMTSTWPKSYYLLLSNSVYFKTSSDYVQWFHGALKPYKHYVPIKNDLSDLIKQIHCAICHDTVAQRIAEKGMHFANESLSEEAVYLYIYKLLQAYASIQKRRP
ncbi:glycosyltransferase family 90 protein, partial [Chlamydiales bacterium]|nr:glycosyltransferase family 90 protein [Chlamydiales bacterium]